MIVGFVSLKTVIAKLYRDLDLNNEIPESSLIEWIAEGLNLIGAYSQFNEVQDCLELTDGKAKLPCDFYKLVDINWNNYPLHWSTLSNASNYQCENCQVPICDTGACSKTFYINDSYIITNITTEDDATPALCIVYLAIPTDEDGYPLVPDNVYYMKALTAYITYMIDFQEWRRGKVPDKVFEYSKQEWLFYVTSAKGAANMPNTAQLENLKNIWQRLMPNPGAYDRSWRGFNRKEGRRLK